jgi:PBP1b-binding outer membrane lipoprotein LpoB
MKKLLVIPAILLFAGCSMSDLSLSKKESNICSTEPTWVLNPPAKPGVVYGIGIAPQNFNGEQAQRKSAVAKAINEIASQLNTTVNSQTITQSVVHNNNGSSSMSNVSFQTVNGQKVSAQIIKSCKNPNSGVLYILMKANR